MNPSSSSLEVSPLSVRGQERLARLRASIHQRFGDRRQPTAAHAHAHAHANANAPPPPPPRAKIRQRLARAAQLTADEIFFREFGSPKQLVALDFELARPSPPVMQQHQQRHADSGSRTNARTEPTATTAAATRAVRTDETGRSHLVATDRMRHAPLSAAERPAAYVSQLQRPTLITTPKKASLKRLRSADEPPSAEKPMQKPRLLSDVTATFNNRSFSNVGQARGVSVGVGVSVSAASFGSSPVRKAAGFSQTSMSMLQQPSPSKFRSSTTTTRLFGQRQTSSYR